MIWELALVAAAYLLGSVPSAWLVVLLVTGKDVRRRGIGQRRCGQRDPARGTDVSGRS